MDKSKVSKMTDILNDCLDNLEGLRPAAGVSNCGRVFVTAQNIRVVIRELERLAESGWEHKEVEIEDDCNSNEIQSDT